MTSLSVLNMPPSSAVQPKKELGLIDGVGVIVGVIIGAGIFVTPQDIYREAGSVGLSLIIWTLSGFLSMIGAMCYAELGTMIPKSGCDYAYINEAFGSFLAFLYLWVSLLVIQPATNAVLALTFAENFLSPLENVPNAAKQITAAAVVCLLTAVNCYNVKWVTKVQNLFTMAKVLALVIIILAGVWLLCSGKIENIAQPMNGSNYSPSKITSAFYFGLFSYVGWNYLNFVTEEIKNPYVNLPRSIYISVPLITVIYLLTNLAYFLALDRTEILNSQNVALDFADKYFGSLFWIMPFFVGCSTFGCLNGNIFTTARSFFAGSRNGHFPKAFALLHPEYGTPIPSLIILCLLTLFQLGIKQVDFLIQNAVFVEASITLLSIASLLWLRVERPEANRPIKVNICFPIVFFVIFLILVVAKLLAPDLSEDGKTVAFVGLSFIVSGIPFYFIFIFWQTKPDWLKFIIDKFNQMCTIMVECV